MTEITKQYVLDLLRADSPEGRLSLLEELPPTPFSSTARALIGSSHPGMVIVAMAPMANQYAYGMSPALGATLASALHERAWELWESTPDHGLLPTTLSGLAASHVKALSLLGRTGEILEVTEDYISRYEELRETENLSAFYVLRLEALVTEERFDEAAEEVEAHPQRFEDIKRNPIWGMELRRLQRRIDTARGSVVEITAPVPDSTSPATEMAQGLLATLGDEHGELREQFANLLGSGRTLDPTNEEDFVQLGRALKQGEQFFSRGSEGDTELTIRGRIREASGIFVHRTPDRNRIRESLAELEHCLAWATAHGSPELQNDSNWGLYLCRSRLDQPSEAADALIALRTGLERRRAGIRNPFERAGVFGDYRYLFPALCEKLQQAGRSRELLEAIESSKGRAIADILTQGRGGPVVEDSVIYECVARLPEVTQAHGFHYLTFFVDDELSYAVLVDKAGALHVPNPIGIARALLQEAALAVDPKAWGRNRGDPGSKHVFASDALAPMVSWLSDLFDQGVLAEGDHVVYSPDEELYNLPLHYLRFRDELVLDWLSSSRVHTAFEIVRSLESAPTRPTRFAGFVVPAKEDLVRDDQGHMVADFRRPVDWLAKRLPGSAAILEEAKVSSFVGERMANAVVHFSAHGLFPEGGNPFRESYLLMADADGLPETAEEVGASGRLTPEVVLSRVGSVAGSHVSMMACVSGRAAEGLGGDALGLDWAFLQAGASSLVSTHWNVSAGDAADFFVRFYQKWLEDGKPRGQAMRETMLELMDGNRDQAALRAWTAFSLTGEFR